MKKLALLAVIGAGLIAIAANRMHQKEACCTPPPDCILTGTCAF